MKTILALLVLLSLTVHSAVAYGVDSPVLVTHKVTRYQEGSRPRWVEIGYTLHVANPGATALSNLVLSVVPAPGIYTGSATFKIGTLGPHQGTDVTLELQAPALTPKAVVLRQPLFLTGTCNSQGKTVEFPTESHPGGAK